MIMAKNTKTILVSLCLALWASALSAQAHYSFDYRQFRYEMTVYFSLQNGDAMVAVPDNYEVAAFVGDECRGVATFENQISAQGVALKYGFLKVYSNKEKDETVTFKCFDKNVTKERLFTDVSVPFVADTNVGYPSSPKPLVLEYNITAGTDYADMGTVEGSGVVKSGSSVTVTATPLEGYQFVRWSNGVSGNPYTFVVDKDVTLKAEFAPKQYTMTFVLDNGQDNITLTQDYKSAVVPPTGFEKTGHTFAGWNVDVPSTMPARDTTFTAQWNRNSYQLTFVSEGQTISEASVLFDDSITTPDVTPTKEGYTFTGWDPQQALTMPAHDQVYTAQFTINQYKVTFVANGVIVKSEDQDFGSAIIAPDAPPVGGNIFLGWNPNVDTTVPAHDVTYTASYNRNDYYATFIVDDEVKQNSQVTFGDPIVAPIDPEKQGYTFTGWQPALPQAMPDYDMAFTATFELNKYAVTWKVDEQTRVDSVTYLSPITKPADPQKEGHTFTGWDAVIPDAMPYDDLTFTAQFSVNKYLVKFVVDSEVFKADSIAYGDPITADAPVKTGYTFTGWSPALEEGATVPAMDVTYTAQFSINQYSVTFKTNDTDTLSTIKQDYASEIVAPDAPRKTGFTFKGWTPEVPATVPDNDLVFVANYERNSYLASFVVDGDTVSQTVLYGSEITKLADPVKNGFTFTGWTPTIPVAMPDGNLTFTAGWSRNNYNVNWLADGDTLRVDTLAFETIIVKPADPTKEGYTFTGWDKEIPATVPAEDLTFTAQFTINQYTMTFVLDNGQENIVKTQNYATALEAPVPTKTGFTFKGWSTAVPATVPAQDSTFTAQWERNSYKLTFVVDGKETQTTVDYEAAITKPADPTKEGYTFTGWDKEIPATMPAADLTITAQFQVNKYAVIYMVNDTVWACDSVAYGEPIVLRKYESTERYIFNQWNSTETYTTMPAHDVVFVADITDGITFIGAAKGRVTVFTVDGRLVARGIAADQLQKRLPKGLYIVNGRKIVIK